MSMFVWLRRGISGVSFEHGSKNLGFVTYGNFHEQLYNYELLKKEPASWNW